MANSVNDIKSVLINFLEQVTLDNGRKVVGYHRNKRVAIYDPGLAK